ncbi:MAG: response regulator [Candidatus Sulfotelmatobacter sp.]
MARKILLADDSVTAQNMGRKILADAGYEVIAVNNGSAALKKIAELKPDLVILDVYMPGYSGLEVCQRLKEAPETARIPVLLTVGKLEPFKPEEAQRVRAEAFIVKPFEASELLSALSKLEDKVVPRPEPSRPGRFARAFAAAEESGRVRAGEENGWKSRISFPHEKTDEEKKAEKSEPQSSIYNPINRDLRTIVETPQEKAEERVQQPEEEKKHESPGRESETIDVAALAPAGVPSAGLPKDVTQEEIAVVTAAAAQIQAAAGRTEEEPKASEATSGAGQETAIEPVETVGFEPPMREIDLEAAAPSLVEPSPVESPIVALPAADAQASDTQDVPVTMAATADSVSRSGESRWTAVAVALEGDEAGLSLDHEMQKASAPAETNTDLDSAPTAHAVAEISASAEASVPEISQGFASASKIALADSASEPAESLVEQSLAAQADAAMTVASATAEQGMDSVAPESVLAQPSGVAETIPVVEDAPAIELGADTNAGCEMTAPVQGVRDESPSEQAAAIELSAPAAKTETTYADFDAAHDPQLEPEPDLEPAAGYRSFHAAESGSALKTEPQPQPPGNQTIESTAAAWANWRQIRDAGKAAQDPSRETETPSLATAEMNAAAVAAGAEQGMARAANPEEVAHSSDVASIVDSVLADLRPKLMQEISRKMSEKK